MSVSVAIDCVLWRYKDIDSCSCDGLYLVNTHWLFVLHDVELWNFYREQDNKDARHVKTYEVQMKEKDFGEGPWLQNNLDNGAGLLIPVPLPLGGAIIIGEQTIVYYNGSVFKAIPIRPVQSPSEVHIHIPVCDFLTVCWPWNE